MSGFDILRGRHQDPLIKSLRVSLARLRERERLGPGDPGLLELQRSILRTITELELRQPSAAKAA